LPFSFFSLLFSFSLPQAGQVAAAVDGDRLSGDPAGLW
jgi:hypothetical protein